MRSQRWCRTPMIANCSSLSLREVLDHVARDADPADRGCNRRSTHYRRSGFAKQKGPWHYSYLLSIIAARVKSAEAPLRRRGSLFAGDFCLQKSRRAYGPGLKNRFGRAEYVFDRPEMPDRLRVERCFEEGSGSGHQTFISGAQAFTSCASETPRSAAVCSRSWVA